MRVLLLDCVCHRYAQHSICSPSGTSALSRSLSIALTFESIPSRCIPVVVSFVLCHPLFFCLLCSFHYVCQSAWAISVCIRFPHSARVMQSIFLVSTRSCTQVRFGSAVCTLSSCCTCFLRCCGLFFVRVGTTVSVVIFLRTSSRQLSRIGIT